MVFLQSGLQYDACSDVLRDVLVKLGRMNLIQTKIEKKKIFNVLQDLQNLFQP